MNEKEIEQLNIAAQLHEVAHLRMPLHMLTRTTLLGDGELKVMQEGFRQGVKMLAEVPELEEIAAVINFQHDHFDGLGSLNRLSGEQIPLHSRILAIADAYDEMREPTSATPGFAHGDALLVLKGGAGRKFDPKLVSIFCALDFEASVTDPPNVVLAAA
jgi:response regulator RpfG family c-di-GMP phosphodiesterase